MKKVLYLLVILFFASCEDEVNVDLESQPPKLVIDANILWEKGTTGNEQKIKLTTTTDFYNPIVPVVSGAVVTITNSSNTVFDFIEVPLTGEYVCTNFVPVINETYTLRVFLNGITYQATEKLLATPNIDSVEQSLIEGVGNDITQIKFFYQDNPSEVNYYLITVVNENRAIPEYGTIEDEFFQGNQMFGFYADDELEAGDLLALKVQGISLRYFNYMNKLINIAGSGGGNPFATPPATLRGNIINLNDSESFPLGYFHLCEIDTEFYTVQ